jgi:CheY-like chemotaxis protein
VPKNTRPLILVVDDEAVVLTYVSNALRFRNFDVLLAEDGERGLALFLTHQKDISLVLTDVSMPRMAGPEMAAEIRKLDEKVPLIFMTGFSPSRVVPEGFNACPMLHKPFTPLQLYEAIDECLEL